MGASVPGGHGSTCGGGHSADGTALWMAPSRSQVKRQVSYLLVNFSEPCVGPWKCETAKKQKANLPRLQKQTFFFKDKDK